MYLEGSDQRRGWFMSSLMISTAMKAKRRIVGTDPRLYRGWSGSQDVSIHAQRRSPQDVMNKLGADILRLWVASTDYTGEMAMLTRS
ncbi:class I tRNA ligase family protein [Shigella flexneri]